MAPTKKVSSSSKPSSQSPKKTKMGSPMKKKLSHNNASPKKSTTKTSDVRDVTTIRRPSYQHMITEAIKTLDSRTGSSRSKIMNHIKVTYGIEGGKSANSHLRTALKVLLEESVVLLAKGTGYSNGYYKIASKGKKQNKKSSSQSTTDAHDKKSTDKPRAQSKSGPKSKTDGQRRSRSSSKMQSTSTNKSKSSGRQSTVSRSRSPIKKSNVNDRKSNQTRLSRSSSLNTSRSSMKKQQTEKPKSPQRGRPKVGQKRQALKEVNDNQKSANKSKQTRSRSSKTKSTGNNHVSASPTKKARNSTGGRSKKGGK